ncbi:metal-dependent hydrolase [Chachezhania antarctica]|uniref:metal-dependent hydrolase n=1 Tax=Chachezhania antarctica TaxID=2340860 RepID=UPI000EB394E6|nr:metal-dependent hydrolase [Chachezhania antarctica]|tara:strand:- start:7540 stop:8232 length:693 start_codon:yes stop_codon:yes gene_type:complete
MKLIWLGHGSFRLETGDKVLLIDPWLTGNPVMPEDRHDEATDGVTMILLTHAHFDHVADVLPLAKKYSVPVIGQFDLMSHWGEAEGIETIGMNKGGTVDLGDVTVSMVKAEHSSTFGTPEGLKAAGSEVGYMIGAEGRMIYFSGDTDVMADMDWFADYYKPDIGILSAGGHFTMSMKAAAYAARRYFNFDTVIPGHYKTFPLLEQSAEVLIEELPDVKVIEPVLLEAIEL